MATPITNLTEEISSLCSTGLRPLIVQGVILRLMAALFSRPSNLNNPILREFIWKDDDRQTKIWIMPLYAWKPDTLQARPAIIVKRNAWKLRQLAIGDGEGSGANWDLQDPSIRPLGNPYFQTAIEGSHTIFIISKEAAECENLATEVFIHLMQYSTLIEREFGFDRFKVAEFGSLSRLDEATDYFIIPITVAYAVVETWQTIQESPLLKGFSFTKNIGS